MFGAFQHAKKDKSSRLQSTCQTSKSNVIIMSVKCTSHYVAATEQFNSTWSRLPSQPVLYVYNFEEVEEVYWFWVVRPCIRLSHFLCIPYLMNRACYLFEISCMKFSWKNSWPVVFLVRNISFWSYILCKKSEWNLMHAISYIYEPCMLGFWNSIYGFLMEK